VSLLLAALLLSATPEERPNILWICTDQQRWDTIGALGNRHIRTPNIDRLAKRGVAFTHAFVQSPLCTPSRASMLTGRYPSSIRACINGNERWSEAAPLVTKLLADAGYDCGLAGKFHLSSASRRIEPRVDDGYRVFHWSHHPWDDWPEGHAYIDWLERQGHDYRALHEKHGYIPTELNQTTWCATMAIDFLEEKRDAPWLFSLNCFDPHPDFDPPEEFLGRFDVDALPGPLYRDSDLAAQRRLAAIKFQSEPVPQRGRAAKLRVAQYWAEVELIDRNVGRLLKALEESGQLDNTLIIFTSDHGTMLGDHGLVKKGCRFYEGLVRVPLIISWPAKLKQGLVSDALVEMVDLAPTLLELTGLELDASGAPGKMHGRSLVPILTGAADPSRHRDLVHCEYHRAIRGMPSYGTMVRTRRHKLVVYHGAGLGGDGLGELFDLEKDPGEFENRWDDPAYAELKLELLLKSFDATVRATDIGPRRVGSY
jgi:arylsulfatase